MPGVFPPGRAQLLLSSRRAEGERQEPSQSAFWLASKAMRSKDFKPRFIAFSLAESMECPLDFILLGSKYSSKQRGALLATDIECDITHREQTAENSTISLWFTWTLLLGFGGCGPHPALRVGNFWQNQCRLQCSPYVSKQSLCIPSFTFLLVYFFVHLPSVTATGLLPGFLSISCKTLSS